MSARENLKNEIVKKAVVHGKVILSSGKEADYYVDLRRVTLDHIAAPLVGEGINHAGIKRIIELESAMANMAVEVAKLRIEVDALLKENPVKGLPTRKNADVIIYKEDDE